MEKDAFSGVWSNRNHCGKTPFTVRCHCNSERELGVKFMPSVASPATVRALEELR